jgi:hypothetical protein
MYVQLTSVVPKPATHRDSSLTQLDESVDWLVLEEGDDEDVTDDGEDADDADDPDDRELDVPTSVELDDELDSPSYAAAKSIPTMSPVPADIPTFFSGAETHDPISVSHATWPIQDSPDDSSLPFQNR